MTSLTRISSGSTGSGGPLTPETVGWDVECFSGPGSPRVPPPQDPTGADKRVGTQPGVGFGWVSVHPLSRGHPTHVTPGPKGSGSEQGASRGTSRLTPLASVPLSDTDEDTGLGPRERGRDLGGTTKRQGAGKVWSETLVGAGGG